MKKGKSSRHRGDNNSSKNEVGPKQVIFNHYIKEMEEKTEKYKLINKDISFNLLQSINNKDKVRDSIFNLVYFYDYNFVGNRDFMHIPNISSILNNILKYPIMLATKKDKSGNEEIIGVSTIKMERNYSLKQNPYYPTCDEDVLIITGVLSKLYANEEDRIHGIGKELFKSAIKAAYNINKIKKIKLITEIDCRNVNSLNAVNKAVCELRSEGINVSSYITGYYEIKKKADGSLIEAPTFIVEFDLTGDKKLRKDIVEFNYEDYNEYSLLKDLSNKLKLNTHRVKEIVNKSENNLVYYYKIKPIDTLNVRLKIGNTAEGNNRVPSIDLQYEVVNN